MTEFSDDKPFFYHALTIDKDICIGCTHCMKSCPTEAIRIRDGKAFIYENKCIDCGQCFKVCPVKAIYIKQDDFGDLQNFKYRIALVPAVFIGQFPEKNRTSQIYSCLKKIGFTHIYEVEHGVTFMLKMYHEYIAKHPENTPYISSFCPAVVRLIQVRFPSLVGNLIHLKAPLDIASIIITQRLVEAGINKDEIGIFYLAPCAAKIAAVKSPVENSVSPVNGVINIDYITNKVLKIINNSDTQTEPINHSLTGRDVKWCLPGGEIDNFEGRCFAIDGLQNVIDFLEKIENEEIITDGIIEMRVCDQGCTGGVLNPNNRFIAIERLKNRATYLDTHPIRKNATQPALSKDFSEKIEKMMEVDKIKPRSILKLDDNLQIALKMVEGMKKIEAMLPAIDCGCCGAPTCSALAEDIVRKQASPLNCMFVKKDNDEIYNIMENIWGNDKLIEL